MSFRKSPCPRSAFFLIQRLLPLIAAGFAAVSAQSPSATFVYGAEPIFIPSEMPPVVRKWDPANKLNEPGIKKGPPFEAALVRVFNEDTPWTSEVAVFRFRDGTVRAWKAKSFSEKDRAVMTAMKAKAPVPKPDARKWTSQLGEDWQKRIEEGTLMKHETAHFVFVWGKQPTPDVKGLMESPDFIQKAGEWYEKVWTAYEVDFQAPMPYAGDRKPRRILVKLYNTGVPGVGNGYANSAREMALTPIAMRYGSTVVGHEFGHVVDAYTGGFMIRSSVGPFWETHAEGGSFSFSPTHGDSLGNMFSHLHHGCQWPESRYSNWAIVMHLWEKKRTRHLIYDPWLKNKRDGNGASEEDQLETTVRLGRSDKSLPDGWESLNDEIGEMGARMVTMDYINQGFLADASAGMRKNTMTRVSADPANPGWFRSPADKALYAYGVHWLPLRKQGSSRQISVAFRGDSKAPDAGWRLTLVAVDGNGVARYSPRVKVTAKDEAKVQIDVKPGEDYVLVVAATPGKYRSLTWDQKPDFDFPYLVQPTGAAWSNAAQ